MASFKATVCLGSSKKPICENCIKADVCKVAEEFEKEPSDGMYIEGCDFFLDRSRNIELPCKIGDILYEICERKRSGKWKKAIVERVVHGIEVGSGGYISAQCGTSITVLLSNLGKTVFLTQEEAARALQED